MAATPDAPGRTDLRRRTVRILRAAARHSAPRTGLLCLTGIAAALAGVALPAVLGHTLDLALDGAPDLGTWIALSTALVAADVLAGALAALLAGVLDARSTAWLRHRGVAHLLALAPHTAARFTPGDVVTRLTANAAAAGTGPSAAAGSVAALLTPLGGLVGLAFVDLWSAAVFAAGLPALVLLLRTFTRTSGESVARYQAIQADLGARLLETLAGARSVAAAGTLEREHDRVLAPLAELGREGRQMWRVYGRAVVRGGILLPLLQTAVLATAGIRLAAGALSVGDLLAITRYVALAAGVGAVVSLLNSLVHARTAAERTGELLAVPPLAHGRLSLPADGPGRLELRRVTVLREGSAVLRDVDLLVPGGSTTAVVGRSGAGKSVLAAVAGRLADPDSGEVRLDDVPLPDLAPGDLRRAIGYAFERPALFGGSVGAAIGFGPREQGAAAVVAAAAAAGADGFVRRLPHGYATPLTDAPLSGGELQRLGLARAFAHAGRLLILDDATSSLDSVTEAEIGRALTRDVRAGSRLIIAHRVSSAARADRVVWLDDGRVRAVGSHRELWRLAAYRAVFAAPDGNRPDDAGGTAPAPATEPLPVAPATEPLPVVTVLAGEERGR